MYKYLVIDLQKMDTFEKLVEQNFKNNTIKYYKCNVNGTTYYIPKYGYNIIVGTVVEKEESDVEKVE
jgi:hypothetical protein